MHVTRTMDHSMAFSLCKFMIAYNYYLTENTHIIFIKITPDLRVVWGIIYYGSCWKYKRSWLNAQQVLSKSETNIKSRGSYIKKHCFVTSILLYHSDILEHKQLKQILIFNSLFSAHAFKYLIIIFAHSLLARSLQFPDIGSTAR